MSATLHKLFIRHSGSIAHTQAQHSSIMRTLSDDVADYVCSNELRERVRDFVQEALAHLNERADIDHIVLNTHSQGTILGFDVLARSPFSKTAALVTSGSPLRKYVDLFSWGDRVGRLSTLADQPGWQWINVADPRDPVADPLGAPKSWHQGDALPAGGVPTLLRIGDQDDTSRTRDCAVRDLLVDNVTHSSGSGLRAHNYWDNREEFIPELANLLRSVSGIVGSPTVVPAAGTGQRPPVSPSKVVHY